MRLKEAQGVGLSGGRRIPPPILVQLGLEGGVLLYFPTFPFFLFDFLSLLRMGLLGLAHQPTKGGCGTPKAYGLLPGGLTPR